MKQIRGPISLLVVVTALAAGPVAAAGDPVAVSPGGRDHVARVATACPTFSWGSVDGAKAYELSIYSISDEGGRGRRRAARPQPEDLVIAVTIPAAATTWTPEVDQCLRPGGSYSWTIREVDEDGNHVGAPSRPKTFRVSQAAGQATASGPAISDEATSRPASHEGEEAAEADAGDLLARSDAAALVTATGTKHKDIVSKLDDLEAKIDDLTELVTPGRINSLASLCFTIPEAAIEIDSGFENELGIQPRVGLGVNLWGNKAEGDVKMQSKGSSSFKVKGGIGATFQICLEGPGRTLVAAASRMGLSARSAPAAGEAVTASLDPLADAMEEATDIVATAVSDHADELGFDPQLIADKTQKAVDLWKGVQLPSNPFELLDPNSDIRMRLRETSDLLPIPEDLKQKLQDPEQFIPDSLEEFNICDPGFKHPLPDGKLKMLVDDVCGYADRVMQAGGFTVPGNIQELADNGIEKIEALANLKDQLLGALDAIIRMEESISASLSAFEATFPNKVPTLYNPPSPPRPRGLHPLCNLRVPPPGCS